MQVRMRSNLLAGARMEGVIIPAWGEVVDLPDDAAKRLIDERHAEDPDGEVTPDPSTPSQTRLTGRGATLAREAAATAALDAPAHEAKAKDIRAWAKDNGLDVPARGAIPAEIREKFDAAHEDDK